MKALPETSGKTNPATQRHITEDLYQQNSCGNVRTCIMQLYWELIIIIIIIIIITIIIVIIITIIIVINKDLPKCNLLLHPTDGTLQLIMYRVSVL
jgi:hypothetical protein